MQFQVVRVAKYLVRAAALGSGDQFGAFAQAGAQYRVCKIGARFGQRCDGVALRRGAAAKAGQLREYEPHPVRALARCAQFGDDCVVERRLRFGEAGQIEVIVYHGCLLAQDYALPGHRTRYRAPRFYVRRAAE